ncbi:MAG: hypothetical protein U1F35_16670 [Steroidobacteraceae bacterium]
MNYTAVSIIELMGEIYTFGEKCGIDADIIKDFFLDAFAHPALKAYASKLKDRKYWARVALPQSRLERRAADAGARRQRLGLTFEIAKVVERKMLRAIEQGMEQSDWSGIAVITRQESGLT